ncbi:MAG: hypothetical protein ACXWLH_03735 [Candidatus Saccharimonadales bacterium]
MSTFMISLLIAVGSTAWIYNKFAKRTGGGNLKPAVIGAAVTGVILFIIVFLTLSAVLKK